jgi:hypothetical protein
MGRAVEMKLDLFGKESAAEFLQKRAGRIDPAGAGRLAAALGHLPLALDHAGAYCRLTGSSFDAYREKTDTRIARAPTGAAYPASVAARARGSASGKVPMPSARRSLLRRRFPSSPTAILRSGRNARRCFRMCWRSPSAIGRASTKCPRPAGACSI